MNSIVWITSVAWAEWPDTESALTDLLNRRAFHERLDEEWERASRHQHPLSCVLLDCDFFKRINDTHGHAAGDTTLKLVAGHLKDRSRSSDILCRYGGEEFCVCLPETDEADAAAWAERVRLAISQATIPGEATRLQSLVNDLLGHCRSGDVP